MPRKRLLFELASFSLTKKLLDLKTLGSVATKLLTTITSTKLLWCRTMQLLCRPTRTDAPRNDSTLPIEHINHRVINHRQFSEAFIPVMAYVPCVSFFTRFPMQAKYIEV
jgi:hypothetical protein